MGYSEIDATFRPIDVWPGKLTPWSERRRSPFKATWFKTLALLRRELWHLGAKDVVLQLAMPEGMIRRDGYPRADARAEHPGIILAFESAEWGPLKYSCDTFQHWEDNLRAIALGLEALRQVDRYGITKRGEQYRGWVALPPSQLDGGALVERGRQLIEKYGSEREALFATHPDRGGNADDFRAVNAARKAQ